jgi:hypothetical protein
MIPNPTQPNQPKREPTKAELEADQHTQHFHRVYGADASVRNASQKYVYAYLEAIVAMPVFSKIDNYNTHAAAMRDGQRIEANSHLTAIKKAAVSQVTKPKVTK